ncbi:DinB family protein [Streptomyces sp. NPDC047046]|uniref:DinB family protein n=1 Tax=Streptomyces sp. NPDC047046 TaxID=3155378 RepID=UPI0033FE2B90
MGGGTVTAGGTDAGGTTGAEGMDPEVSVLRGALRAQRAHVLGALEGLDEEALRRGVLPSGWSCLGLLRHLALDVERFWFRGVLAAEGEVVASVTGTKAGDDAWRPAPGDTGESLRALYRAEAERADAVLDGLTAAEPPAWWPGELFGSYRLHTVREVLVHVLTETACHAGHADAVRELLDGRQWLVLDG